MENIVRTIRAYYPVSDEALATLAHGFERNNDMVLYGR